eukprot:scaffold3836_cov125-Isochrysis_galbana.AAC.7
MAPHRAPWGATCCAPCGSCSRRTGNPRACPRPSVAFVALHPVIDVLGPVLFFLFLEIVDLDRPVRNVRQETVGRGTGAEVSEATLAQLHAPLVARLLPIRPARVDRLKALFAEHGRRLEGALVCEADVANHAAALMRDAFLLDAAVHHDVVHGF